jgi:hypothetical protein
MTDHREHPSSTGDQLAVTVPRSGVKDNGARHLPCFLDTRYDFPRLRVFRISGGSENHAHMRLLPETRRPRRQDACRRRSKNPGQSSSSAVKTTCASGSPKRTLNSITFGPSVVSIKPT